jgi:hypothetical protein
MFTKKQMIATLCLGLLTFGAQAADQKPSDRQTLEDKFSYIMGFGITGFMGGVYVGTKACKDLPVLCPFVIPTAAAIGGAAGALTGVSYYLFHGDDKKTSNEKPPQS